MSKDKKNQKKKEKEDKSNAAAKDGKIRLILPKDLESKIRSESNPDGVVAEALMEFYSERSRSNSIIQKEIDNNIIEIQRRHISDLKEQLEAVNHNYEELMKTYQAYMLQVQPLIEKAQLADGTEVKKISAAKGKEFADEEKLNAEAKESAAEKTEPAPLQDAAKAAAPEKSGFIVEKKKKWYEFWKK